MGRFNVHRAGRFSRLIVPEQRKRNRQVGVPGRHRLLRVPRPGQEKLKPKPGISLTKTGPASAFKGDSVSFHFNVTNTGGVDFSNVLFNDDLLGIHDKSLGALAARASKEWDETYTIPSDYHNHLLHNDAGVTGKSDCKDATATADCRVEVKEKPKPGITLTKTGPVSACLGDQVTFHFKVKNTGEVNFTNVLFNDDLLGIHNKSLGALAVGASKEWDETYTIPAGCTDASIKNTAGVTGLSDGKDATATAECSVKVDRPGIKLEKWGPASANVGETITYNFKITNSGDGDLVNVKVNDPLLGGDILTLAMLAHGSSYEFSKTYTIPQDFIAGTLENSATVTATHDCDNGCQVSGDASWETTVTHPSIIVTKSGPDCARVGDTITYNFTVKNNGDSWLFWANAYDPMLGGVLWGTLFMAPGDVATFSKTYVVKDTDPDPLYNKVTAVGGLGFIPCISGTVSATAEWSVDIINPKIELTKTPSDTCFRVGDTVTYDFTVKNAGDCRLTGVTVSDPMLGGTIFGPVDMDVGTQQAFSKTYLVKDGDPNQLLNEATATGTPPCGTDVTAKADASVDIIHPKIELVKGGPAEANVGDTVTYDPR